MKTEPITYYIVENDENTIRLLEMELKEFPNNFKSKGVFRDFKEAHNRIYRDEPNLIFMNIEFPFFTGAEFFGNTSSTKCDYVFLAKDNNYVYQNVKASKFDCILKPISQTELKRTLKRKVEMRESGRVPNYGHYLPASTDYKFKKLLFPTTNGYVFLSPDDILYCEADLEYTKIITRKQEYLISKNLKHFDNMLNGKRFIRSHKSFLINIDHIKQYVRSEGGHVIMSNDKMVPIGRSKKPQFAHLLGV